MTRSVKQPNLGNLTLLRSSLIFILTLLGQGHVLLAAEGDDSHVCDQISNMAAAQTGVPVSVLKAIALTETGRKKGSVMRPWPWTVNMEGKGIWFDTEDDARAYVYKHFKRGARSFDVGCFQINYRWHHQNFSSLEEMFDPLANGLYAAKFLAELFAEKGNWTDAAGAYHSRTPKFADRYKKRFAIHRAQLTHQDAEPMRMANMAKQHSPPQADGAKNTLPTARINTFPLLQAGQGQRGIGSLVPLGNSTGSSLFTQTRG